MKFKSLVPEMVVYSVTKGKMGNTTLNTVRVHQVLIVSTNPENETVIASWNGNAHKTFHASSYEKWRKTKPEVVTSGFGLARLATRAEIEAKKSVQADADLVAWQKTNRTHEECATCPFEHTMPAPCKGHPSGPVPCTEKGPLTKSA